jgi:carbon-monoxide dehydrogenase small subunit
MNVTFTLNGRERTLDVPPHLTLLQALRDTLGVFDAKEGCDEGVCGACTVLMDGRPVSSCLVLVPMARARTVVTLRGIAGRAAERTGAGVPGARGEHLEIRAAERTGAGVPGARGEHLDGQNGPGLHPIQEAFLAHGAVQCGFCTPGMVLTALVFVEGHPDADREAVRHAIEGNLCRCTGYTKIVDAVVAYARARRRGG